MTISRVWEALGGGPLRRRRGRAFWRCGDGWNVSLDDAKGAWHDFATGDGGGVLDLIQLVRDCSRQDALRWLADYAGIPLVDRALSPEEKRAYAEARAAEERDLPRARWFARAAAAVAEQVLESLDPAHAERLGLTRLVAALRDAGALATYRAWGPRRKLVRALVAAGRASDAAAQRDLARLLMEGAGAAAAA